MLKRCALGVLVLIVFSFHFMIEACPAHRGIVQNKSIFHHIRDFFSNFLNVLNASEDVSSLPFGGSDPARWTEEALIANGIQQIFDEGVRENALDVVVSIPVQFHDSNYHPYGDGQSNAHLSFGEYWNKKSIPVMAALFRFADGGEKLKFYFDSSLEIKNYTQRKIEYQGYSWWLIQPENWKDSFIVGFDDIHVLGIDDFVSGIPDSVKRFSDGRSAVDPEEVFKKARLENKTAYAVLKNLKLGPGYNSSPYEIANIHGLFPNEEGTKTAVGGGWTWVIEKGNISPIKHLYTCFSGRNSSLENRWGVPSGSGWHLIGDPAESILNTLESVSIPVAVGRKIELNERIAYGLNGVITAQYLKPREVFVTSQGEYHWYLIPKHVNREMCAEIWVHNCVPSPENHWGFQCH